MNKTTIKKILLFTCLFMVIQLSAQETPPEMKLLEPYVGLWKEKRELKNKEGEIYHFGYQLKWFDQNRTIVKMLVTMDFDNGQQTTLWEGFKGWDPIKKEVYYHGFSPQGRFARGHVKSLSDTRIDHIYIGATPDGKEISIRDEFTLIDEEHF